MVYRTLDNATGRVGEACKAVLRHIQAHGLRRGDRLENQQELRSMLGFSNDTLSAAMRYLSAAGVLTRKSKVGTIISEPDAPLRGLWTVAVLAPSSTQTAHTPYYTQIVHLLQGRFREAGDGCQLYFCRQPDFWAGLEDFVGLSDDLRARRVDGLVSVIMTPEEQWPSVVSQGVPMVYAGPWEQPPCGVFIDQAPMVREAFALLAGQGCRRMAVVAHGPPKPGMQRYWDGFCQAREQHAGGVTTMDQPLSAGMGVLAGQRVAADLLAMSAESRPDGLIVVDDFLASGLTATLVQQADYRPRLVVQTNLQGPLAFSLPVFRFDVDCAKLAQIGADMLLDRLQNPLREAEVQTLVPEFAGLHENEHPLA